MDSRLETLTPRNHLLGRSTVDVGLIEYNVGSHVCWPGGQHLLLTVNQVAGVKCRQLKTVPVRNRVRRARFHAIAAKNTSVVINVINLGVAFRAAYTVFVSIVGSFDIDAVRRTVGGAQEARDAFFQPVLVALQHVSATEPRFDACAAQRTVAVRIVLYRRRLEHLHKGDAHAFGDGSDVFQDRHTLSSIPKATGIEASRSAGTGWSTANANLPTTNR